MKNKKKILSFILSALMTCSTQMVSVSDVHADNSDICINEVCSQNKNSIADSYGKYSDWIELYNNGNSAIDISGYGISDNADTVKYVFPNGTKIGAKEYMVVFASKSESTADEIHLGFSISKNGETLYLSSPDGNIIQTVNVPTLGEDSTYGMTPDGSGKFEIMEDTPKKANSVVTSAPEFSQKSGFYGTDFSLSLSAEAGTKIYYTTDGSNPTNSSTAQLYNGAIKVEDRTNQPNIYSNYTEDNTAQSISNGVGYKAPSFNVDKATVVRACAKSDDGKYSSVESQTYFITNGNLSKYKDMTVVSLVTNPDNLFDPDTGIYVVGNQYLSWKNSGSYDPNLSIWDTSNPTNYYSKGKDWEREADITIFENGSAVVEQGMGIRIKGASTRNHAQKSFNIYARSEYGASKIDYPIFEDNFDINGNLIEKYDSLSLRSVIDENRLNDSFSQGLLEGRDVATQAMKPCVVFLNGEYWGLYEITERISDYYVESNYDVDKQDVTIIKNGECESGSQEECDEFFAFADKYASMDLSKADNYKAVCEYIDIDSMIEHYAAGIYLGTYDWPNRNYGAWKNSGESDAENIYSDGKWRFITFDLDYTLGANYTDFEGGVEGYAYDSIKHIEQFGKDAPTNLFLSLLKNETFKNKFASVICDYANEVAEKDKGIAKVNEYSSKYSDLVGQTLTRWWGYFGGTPESTYTWNVNNYKTKVLGNIENFFLKRDYYATYHMKNYLGYSGDLQKITLKQSEHGKIQINSIVPDLSNGSWSGSYFSDCPVTLTAIPDDGYSFAGWGGDADGNDTTITVSLSKAMTITASFGESAQSVKGDVNADGVFNISDAVTLQKWLLAVPDVKLSDWKSADLCEDGELNIFDLSMMKHELISK